MSTIKAVAPYQIETFGKQFGGNASRDERRHREALARTRSGPFIAQLLIGADAGLRAQIGRRDLAEGREAAYASALANRPSARPLSFLADLGKA